MFSRTISLASLRKTSVFSREMGGASMEVLCSLYRACVRSHILFSYPVWSSNSDVKQLEKVQNLALRSASGAMDKSKISSLELLCQIPPLDLVMQQSIVKTFVQIYRLPDTHVLKRLVKDLMVSKVHLDHKQITAIHKYNMSKNHLCTSLDLENIEPLTYETMEDILTPPVKVVHIPNHTGKSLGNSKNRTEAQAALAKRVVEEYLDTIRNDIIVYVDGSALKNPGPCGAGAVIFWNGHGHHPTSHSSLISARSSSYHGELGGIELAFDVLNESVHNKPVHILVDCQSALDTASSTNMAKNHAELQRNIKKKHNGLLAKVKSVDISWVGGHINLLGNDLADTAAKEAANSSSRNPHLCKYNMLSPDETSTIIKSGLLHAWKSRCKTLDSETYLLPAPSLSQCKSAVSREGEVKLNRIKLQHHKLNDHMNKIMPHAYISAECGCGTDRQTVEHVLLHCSLLNDHRDNLICSIERSFRDNNLHIFRRSLSIDTLLKPNYTDQINKDINTAVAAFLVATDLDI